MIEVRIARRDVMEYATREGAEGYIYGRLCAANVPISRTGMLDHGLLFSYTVFDGDYLVYQWSDEMP